MEETSLDELVKILACKLSMINMYGTNFLTYIAAVTRTHTVTQTKITTGNLRLYNTFVLFDSRVTVPVYEIVTIQATNYLSIFPLKICLGVIYHFLTKKLTSVNK